MKFREANPKDIDEIVNILKQTFSEEDSKSAENEVKEMFSNSQNKPTYIIAEENNKIIAVTGYIQSWFDFNAYEIFWVAVHPNYQGSGIGKKIIEYTTNEIKKIKEADIIILSTEATPFFIKCGFEKIYDLPNNKGTLLLMKLK